MESAYLHVGATDRNDNDDPTHLVSNTEGQLLS
jgi:hypothetical protein